MKNKLEEIHYVYGWRNLLDNNFFYIGVGKYQKTGKYNRSYAKHYYKKRDKTRAQYKREKLGENCIIEILYDCLTLNERIKLEQELIEKYNTIDNGGILYNHTKGGDYNPMFDPIIREKHRLVMQSDEHRQKISDINSIVNNTPEYKEKQSKKSLEVWSREGYREKRNEIYTDEFRYNQLINVKNRKEVEYNGIIYPSKKALARFLGISSQSLNYKINNKTILVNFIGEL